MYCIKKLELGSDLSLLEAKDKQQRVEFILPTLRHNYLDIKTILDPVLTPKAYQLPTIFDVTQEKLTPALARLTPIEDPHPLQKVSFSTRENFELA